MPRPTLKDVATQAGVSEQTVSLVINNRAGVSEATRARVRSIIQSLGYVPAASARALRGGGTRTLGVVYPGTRRGRLSASGYLEEILNGICAAANQAGYHVLLHPLSLDGGPQDFLEFERQGRVDGLISVVSELSEPYQSALQSGPLPVVSVQRPIAGAYSVRADNRGGTRAAVAYLAGRGHRRVAYLGAGMGLYAGVERYEGYREGLAIAGLRLDPRLVRHATPPRPDVGPTNLEGDTAPELVAAMRITGELLSLADRPTAMVCFSDLYAIGALRAAKERGLSIPQDFAVIGFNNFALAAAVEPPLTTVNFPAYDLGHLATDLLIRLTGGERPEVRDIVLSVNLVLRQTA